MDNTIIKPKVCQTLTVLRLTYADGAVYELVYRERASGLEWLEALLDPVFFAAAKVLHRGGAIE
jgi:hypothetical protein